MRSEESVDEDEWLREGKIDVINEILIKSEQVSMRTWNEVRAEASGMLHIVASHPCLGTVYGPDISQPPQNAYISNASTLLVPLALLRPCPS
jgi:hypothetical protein